MSFVMETSDESAGDLPVKPHEIPAAAIRGIATGLFMMAFFTGLWAGIAFGGLQKSILRITLVIFLIFIILFIIHGIRLFGIARHFPGIATSADLAERKRMGKWFGIIFGAEGLGIFLAINIVINLGHPDLVIPVLALVVGIHFYPMARILRRKIDYYLATWSTMIAVCGILFTLYKSIPPDDILTFVGVGIALATSAYGMYMILHGNRLIRMNAL
jgi:hypothetical protein